MTTKGRLEEFDGAYSALFHELTALCRALGAWDEAEDVVAASFWKARQRLARELAPTDPEGSRS